MSIISLFSPYITILKRIDIVLALKIRPALILVKGLETPWKNKEYIIGEI